MSNNSKTIITLTFNYLTMLLRIIGSSLKYMERRCRIFRIALRQPRKDENRQATFLVEKLWYGVTSGENPAGAPL